MGVEYDGLLPQPRGAFRIGAAGHDVQPVGMLIR
jgi:hypothetical protein